MAAHLLAICSVIHTTKHISENLVWPNYFIQHFVTVLTEGGDLYSAFPDEIDAVGVVAKHEDPLTALAFGYSHHGAEVLPCLLTHSVQQLESP